jgi:hypothetical protein
VSILLQTLAMIIWKPNVKSFPPAADRPVLHRRAVITPTQI